MAPFIDKLRTTSMVTRLILVNVAVFLLLHIAAAANIFTGDRSVEQAAMALVELPAALMTFATHPWTLVTYMFTQFDVFHILFNMLWLYWFGIFFSDISTSRQLLGLYIAGGLIGGLLFMAAANLLPGISSGATLIGSSASVLAIVAATAILTPDREIGLLFIGGVKLKWIALVMVAFDLINLGTGNAGGHIAHLGGAAVGVAYGIWRRSGVRIAPKRPRQQSAPTLEFHPRHTTTHAGRPAAAQPATTDTSEATLNRLLDKIKSSGYGSLSPVERATLLRISEKMREK